MSNGGIRPRWGKMPHSAGCALVGVFWETGSVVFVADDLAAWLIGLLADAGRKKLTALVFGTDQERALRSAATAAVWLTAEEMSHGVFI
jgi:hypothetical protein